MRRRYLLAFAERFGWHPRQVDDLTLGEFELFCAYFDQINAGG